MAENTTLENSSGNQPLAAPAPTATAVPTTTTTTTTNAPYPLPRVTIRFCTQCKWMLRATYFAQELLSTFSTALGEVALQPSTGGTFVVELFFQEPSPLPPPSSSSSPPKNTPTSTSTSTTPNPTNPSAAAAAAAAAIVDSSTTPAAIQRRVLWDRKVDGGFPETKELKRRVRDAIEPGRNLGHVDRDYGHGKQQQQQTGAATAAAATAIGTTPAATTISDATTAGTQSQPQPQPQLASATEQPETKGVDGEVCEDCR